MATTGRGLEISTDDPDAVAALDTFTHRFARLVPGAEVIVGEAQAMPGVASLQLAAAALYLTAQTGPTDGSAAGLLRHAGTLESTMNEREQAWLGALRNWAAGRYLAGVETFEALLETWPADLLALKALEFLYYVTGQQFNGPRFLARVEALAPDNPGDPDVLAVWAFAAELAGDPDRSLDLADRAVDLAAHNPWAHHAIAHALITRGDPESAVARLDGYLPVWESSARFIHGHNAWHLAVAHLDRLDTDAARRIHRDHVWGFEPDTPVEQVDAASLLWRLELAAIGGARGEAQSRTEARVDIDAEVQDLADHVERRATECHHPFLSAHHAWVLARADRPDALDALLATVAERTDRDDPEARRVWRTVGRTLVEASAAHGAGDLTTSATLLDRVIDGFTAGGGSDAQNDLFRQAYLVALLTAGRTDDARTWYDRMTSWKTPSPLDERFAARLAVEPRNPTD